MSHTKQTALQWFKDVTYPYLDKESKEYVDILFNHALQMEREQVISNYCSGFKASGQGWNGEYGLNDMLNVAEEIEAEKYYQETYGETKN